MKITLLQKTDLYEVIYKKKYYKLKITRNELTKETTIKIYDENNKELQKQTEEIITLLEQFKKES